MVGLDFTNNIADMGTYGVSGTGTVGDTLATLNTWWTNWTFTHNAIAIIGEEKYPLFIITSFIHPQGRTPSCVSAYNYTYLSAVSYLPYS